MIERQIESPIPVPVDLVVKKALNSWSAFSAEIPTPQSAANGRRCCQVDRSSAWRWPAPWSANPRVLAFDEPLGALDALTRISMQRLLERVWHDQAFTAILVTHDVAEAVALADRVLVIEHGRIARDVHVDISRPRRRGCADLAALEGAILRDLLQSADETSDL